MKKYKFAALTAFAVLMIASLASCRMSLNSVQELAYERFLLDMAGNAKDADYPAKDVKRDLEKANYGYDNFSNYLFKVIDKRPKDPIKKGTGVEALRKRFIPKKL